MVIPLFIKKGLLHFKHMANFFTFLFVQQKFQKNKAQTVMGRDQLVQFRTVNF